MPVKIAFIGAGSIGFTRTLIRDVLTVPQLQDTHFALHDINKRNLDMIGRLCRKDIKDNELPAKITTSLQRKRALEDTDYVVNCTRIGGLEAFELDIEIPLKYGVDQCVGDTICAGGIMYGQRNVPQIRAFQKDIKAVAADHCLLLNYANPMAINTWAALDACDRGEGVNTIGLCHGVEGTWHKIARALGAKHYKDVDIIAAGINHQTWFTRIVYKGREITGETLLKAMMKDPAIARNEKTRLDVLNRFGYFSTESNGHLSEYLPWYRKRPNEIRKWIGTSHWDCGETGGYLRFCREGRDWFEAEYDKWMKDAGRPISPQLRSHERGSYIIEALETDRTLQTFVNVRNNGCITNLPDDCIVEVPACLDRSGIQVNPIGDLPLACAATCNASINVQRMAKEAAVHGDVTLLKQAMLHDPLVAAVCNPPEVWQMTDEMLVAQAEWLPNYKKSEINAATKRLDAGKIKTRKWKGTSRKK